MKVSTSEIKSLVRTILSWTFLNISLNMIGLFITKLLNNAEFTYFESITNEFVKPLIVQSLLFSICLTVAFAFLKNKKYVPFVFVAFQFLVFHVIFFLNLKINHGLHFESTFTNPGLSYLSYCGQYLVDILYLFFPISGIFENGLFKPDNIGTFYIHWILLNIVYYFALTWLSLKVANFFFENKTELKSVQKEEDKTESES